MKQKYIVLFIMIGAFAPLLGKNFPFGSQGRFTNREYVSGVYNIMRVNFDSRNPLDITTNFGKIQQKIGGGGYIEANRQLSYSGDRFKFNDKNGDIGLIVRKFGNKKNEIYTLDQVICYFYNSNSKQGSKVVLDIDKFENFLHQTYEFDNLDGKGVGFGCSIPDLGIIHISFNFSIETFRRYAISFAGSPISIAYDNRNRKDIGSRCEYNLFQITDWRSYSKGEHITYDDLYNKGIIKKESLTPDDIKEILKK